MYETLCTQCGKIRKTSQKPKGNLCRSCAKKNAIRDKTIHYKEKRCAFCNELFIPNNNKQIYCKKPHYRICPICGKKYLEDNVENLKRPPIACSYACRAKATQQTSLKRYGCIAPGNNPEARKKSAQTMLERYGVEHAMSSPIIREKSKREIIKKYGYDNAHKNPEIIQKAQKTMIERYGTFNVNSVISKTNLAFQEKLKKSGINSTLELHLGSKFYDIAITDTNILIEINPTYTHNVYGNHWGVPVTKTYHLEKTQIAEKAGYRCIHVFDWDDWDKIISLLLPTKSIYARDCTIYKLKNEVAREFTKLNHLQESCKGQVFCLGLVKNDELYQVMTFGRPRYNKNYAVELLRLCSKTGYRVVGGASRLFKYATQNFGLTSIISYCNYSKFSGNVYEEMGMKYLHTTQPQEIWSKENKHVTASLLRARGYDQLFGTHYGKGVSNEMLMLQNGWLPVFDCGQKVFVYD